MNSNQLEDRIQKLESALVDTNKFPKRVNEQVDRNGEGIESLIRGINKSYLLEVLR